MEQSQKIKSGHHAGRYVANLVDRCASLGAKVARLEQDAGELPRRWIRDDAEAIRSYVDVTRGELQKHCPPEMISVFLVCADAAKQYAETLIDWLDACDRPSWDGGRAGAIQMALDAMQEAAHRYNDLVLQVAATTGEESAQAVEEHERMCNELADRPALLERYRRAVAPQIARLKAVAAKWSKLTGPLF